MIFDAVLVEPAKQHVEGIILHGQKTSIDTVEQGLALLTLPCGQDGRDGELSGAVWWIAKMPCCGVMMQLRLKILAPRSVIEPTHADGLIGGGAGLTRAL